MSFASGWCIDRLITPKALLATFVVCPALGCVLVAIMTNVLGADMLFSTVFVTLALGVYAYGYLVYSAGWLPDTYKGHLVPKGPFFKPIVGHLFDIFMRPDLHTYLEQLNDQYNRPGILKFQFGQSPAFVIDDMALIKEIFDSRKPEHAGRVVRVDFADSNYAFGRNHDILISNADAWKTNRSAFEIALKSLNSKSVGTLHSTIERIIQYECENVCQLISDGKPFVPNDRFIDMTFKVICRMMVGRIATPEEKAAIVVLQTDFPKMSLSEIVHRVPDFLLNPMFGNRHEETRIMVDKINAVVDDWIQNPASDDCIIAIMKTNGTDPKSIRGMVMDMFVAGYDSVKFHMVWFVHLITMHPEVQQRLQSLLINGLRDEYEKYLDMVYKEVMRYRPIMLSGFWYQNTRDIIVSHKNASYILPKYSYLFYNTWAIHHDKAFWGDPENFRPDRFGPGGVSAEDRLKHYIGFFTGRRACMGEVFARLQIKTLMTSLLDRFSFESDVPLNDDTFVQVIMAQKPFYLRATPCKVQKK